MLTLLQDLKVALRSLRKAPLTLFVTVVSLGLGIGAVTSVFTLVNSLLFTPPVGPTETEQLITLYTSRDDGGLYGRMSFPDYEDSMQADSAVADALAYRQAPITLNEGSASRVLVAEAVTPNYFEVLGIRLALGRAFLSEEEATGSNQPVAVISHELWSRHFAADREALGKTVQLGGRAYTVIGVAPEGTRLRPLIKTDVWLTIPSLKGSSILRTEDLEQRDARLFTVIARLKDGASLEELTPQLAVIGQRLHKDHQDDWSDDAGKARVLSALSEKDARMPPDRMPIFAALGGFLFSATALILLIACSNVASLFLARAHQRRRETAVRLALGASRRRLVTMALTESLLAALASAALGLALAAVAARALASVPTPAAIPVSFALQMDFRVLAFAILIAIGTTLTFGLAPALAGSRPNLVPSLKSDSTNSGKRSGRFGMRNLLVVAQVAASLVLLAGAGLFMRSLQNSSVMSFGLDPSRIAVTSKTLPEELSDAEAGGQAVRALVSKLAALPEVESAHMARAVELTVISSSDIPVSVTGYDTGTDASPRVHFNSVTPGYLEMLGVEMLRGRGLQDTDSREAFPVAVINAFFAQRFWPGRDALGQRFVAGEKTFEVVGVTADIKTMDIDDPPLPYFWTSLYQDFTPKLAILIESRTTADAMVSLLRREVKVADGETVLVPPTPLAQMVDLQFLPLRAAAAILGTGGVFGLLLAVLGIYGIIAFAVAQRTREIAIRLAIGAQRREVLRTIVLDGLLLTLAGLALGLIVVLPAAQLVRSLLVDTSPLDPLALGGGAGLLLLAALTASYLPAQRATKIDPIRALREE